MELKTYFAQDASGNIMPGATVTVYEAGTATLATGLQDESGSPLANPFNADSSAKVAFYAPDGLYDITVVGNGRTVTIRAQFVSVDGASVLRADLAATGGSALVGYDGGTAQDVLDDAKPMANYTALRAYTGRATGVRITQTGLAGFFWRDASDTTSADNGGTVIVDGAGRRWFRLYNGAVNIRWFGAKGDGVTDDRLAIKASVAAVQAAGGGELVFPRGDYLIATMEGTYNLPDLDGNIQWATAAYDVQLYFIGLSNIVFRFEGARLVSSKTNGGITLAFDGCNNLVFENPSMQGATVMSGSTPTTTGTGAIAILSTSQDSSNIVFHSPKTSGHYSAIDVLGNPASSYRARNITVDGSASFRNGYYGVVCRGNGLGVRIVDAYSYRLNRPFFVYDTQDVHINMVCDDMNGGFQAMVKAYTVNVLNVTIDMSVRNRANINSCLGFQSQHNPAVQPTPCFLRDINVRYTDFASVAGGESIRFDYYQNSTLTATTSQFLFGDIELEGRSSGSVLSGVTLSSIANYCVLYMEKFRAANGFEIYTSGSGFIPARIATWTPTDVSSAALSLTNNNGRYTVGGVVTGSFSVTYPVTASTDSAGIAGLPVKSHFLPQSAVGVSVSYTDCGFPIYGLIGAGDTKINWYKNTGASVTNQELSGKTVRGSFTYFA